MLPHQIPIMYEKPKRINILSVLYMKKNEIRRQTNHVDVALLPRVNDNRYNLWLMLRKSCSNAAAKGYERVESESVNHLYPPSDRHVDEATSRQRLENGSSSFYSSVGKYLHIHKEFQRWREAFSLLLDIKCDEIIQFKLQANILVEYSVCGLIRHA